MSLPNEMTTECVMLDRKSQSDGEGGFFVEWIEGGKFMAAVVYDTSIEARVAEKQGVTNLYTVSTSRKSTLRHNDVFKRLYDGKIFRVTSDGADKFTPASANLDMRVVTAQEWSPTA